MTLHKMNTNPTSTKEFSWRSIILLFLVIGLLVAGLSIFLQTQSLAATKGFSMEAPISAVQPPATPGIGSSFDTPSKPVRLIIPAIGVNANIQSVSIACQRNGEMGIPTNFTDVGWYNQGPLPGAPGSAVIDGHLDGKNVPQAVFYHLGDLKPGDVVEVVDKGGKTLQFRVTGSTLYDYNAPTSDIFSSNDTKAHLNLITCAGNWMKAQKLYNKRVVVFTELVIN